MWSLVIVVMMLVGAVGHVECLHALWNDDGERGADQQPCTQHRHQVELLLGHGHEQRDGAGEVAAGQHHDGQDQQVQGAVHGGGLVLVTGGARVS